MVVGEPICTKMQALEYSGEICKGCFVAHLAVILLLVARKMVLQLATVVAVPASARMVANRGSEGVTRPTCWSVPRPVVNSTWMVCAVQACWHGVIQAAGQQEIAAIVVQHTKIDDRNPPIANLPTHTSAKGLKPKMPSSTGSPMFSENCSNVVRSLVLFTPD